MSSNSYNPYPSYSELEQTLPTSTSPKMSQDELDAELEFWIRTQFTYDMAAPMGLLEDDYAYEPKETKVETENREATTNYTEYSLLKPYLDSSSSMNGIFPHPTASRVADMPRTTSPPSTPIASASTTNYLPICPAPAVAGTTGVEVGDMVMQGQVMTGANNLSTRVSNASRKNSGSKAVSDSRKLSIASKSSDDQNVLPQQSQQQTDPELSAKLAAEEDKRRRNTAASARFRIKKKMREQALERTAREMTAKVEALETKLRELELENKWLRSLVVEKDPRLLDVERPGKRRKSSEDNDESTSTASA
ncbi:3898_t:CDS:1 [Paraglomus occultum]|uniref:3898_t:CDS:1 n=1 Tax=Paraglomus occultum TaxID=144539 RepID=A0A9N9CHP2_9GLOM|nr:3898_t:CDS:1 [Paraglomus occultum]